MAARVVGGSWRWAGGEERRFSDNHAGCAGDILRFWGLEKREI